MIRCLAVLALALLSACPLRAQNPPALPRDAAATIEAALRECDAISLPHRTAAQLDEAGARLDAALDRLPAQLGATPAARWAALEGGDIRGKLVAIALDRQARPEAYREIASTYLTIRRQQQAAPHVIHARALDERHVAPSYRLVWEYVLLCPTGSAPELYDQRAIQAIRRVGDPASLPALVQGFGASTAHGVDTRSGRLLTARQAWLTLALLSEASPDALSALLECARVGEEAEARQSPGHAEHVVASGIRNLLGEHMKADAGGRWRAILAEYRARKLTAAQRALLELVAPGGSGEGGHS